MSEFELIVEPATLAAGGMGPTTGAIWMEVKGRPFPGRGWHDFPEVILAWWMTELTQLVSEKSDTALLRFMDGPFACRLRRRGPSWQLAFDDRSLRPEQPPNVEVAAQDFCDRVLRAAEQVAEAVAARRIQGRDSKGLRTAIDLFVAERAVRGT